MEKTEKSDTDNSDTDGSDADRSDTEGSEAEGSDAEGNHVDDPELVLLEKNRERKSLQQQHAFKPIANLAVPIIGSDKKVEGSHVSETMTGSGSTIAQG